MTILAEKMKDQSSKQGMLGTLVYRSPGLDLALADRSLWSPSPDLPDPKNSDLRCGADALVEGFKHLILSVGAAKIIYGYRYHEASYTDRTITLKVLGDSENVVVLAFETGCPLSKSISRNAFTLWKLAGKS